eukprot:13138149-Alexandrium_andersonii.AAC.1
MVPVAQTSEACRGGRRVSEVSCHLAPGQQYLVIGLTLRLWILNPLSRPDRTLSKGVLGILYALSLSGLLYAGAVSVFFAKAMRLADVIRYGIRRIQEEHHVWHVPCGHGDCGGGCGGGGGGCGGGCGGGGGGGGDAVAVAGVVAVAVAVAVVVAVAVAVAV